jgi:hypothetical protein
MTAADQATTRIDRSSARSFGLAALDHAPRLSGAREAEVIDREVLGGGEAIVHFEGVDRAE